jgi:hypothetical protein
VFHGLLDSFQKLSLGGRSNTKAGDPWHFERSQPLVYFISSCVRIRVDRNSLKEHLAEGPVTYDFTLHSRVRDHTT